jgi:hypothetical protein
MNTTYAVLALGMGYPELKALAHATLQKEHCKVALMTALERQKWRLFEADPLKCGWSSPSGSTWLWLTHDDRWSWFSRDTTLTLYFDGWPHLKSPARDLPDILARMLQK